MEVNKRKDNLVKLLLNKDFDIKDEDELVEMLLDSPIAIDSDKEEDAKRSLGDKLADKVTAVAGSWGFIIVFCIFLILWMIINYLMIVNVDPYPFILLNLILSCIAALQAPIIMMSQNRAAKKDSLSNCIMENIQDFERSQRLQNEIKLYYLSREYALFLKSFEKNLYSKKILHKVKLDITSGRKYQYFDTLGLDVNSNFEEDLRAFFANYKIAAKKIKELESLIELSQKNRGIHL